MVFKNGMIDIIRRTYIIELHNIIVIINIPTVIPYLLLLSSHSKPAKSAAYAYSLRESRNSWTNI